MPILKIHFQTTGDVRRMTVPDWPDLPVLHGLLTSMFGPELPMPYTLKYTDPDGDLISITSTPELREAVGTAGRSGVLNLFVGMAVAGSSASISLAAMPRVSSAPSMPSSAPAPSPHSIQLPDFSSVAMSQAHDTLFIDDLAPAQFVADFRQLLQMNCGWEQTRDALIDYGGDVTLARAALRAGPRRPSSPTSRHYFSVAFARAAVDLSSKAGFPIRDVVAALIRNAGVAANALTELSSQAADLRCPSGHPLEVSSYNLGDYATQWYCDRCRKADKPGQRWFCLVCKYDVCFACQPAPRVPTASPSLYPSPAAAAAQPPLISDMSLPPTLLQPVKVLEAMGFSDRAQVIEALVAAQGDIVRAATQLADQRRVQEEREAKEARRRRLAEERAERQRQEAERKRQQAERREAEARQRAIEAKRQEAAKVVVQTPEKIGSDLAYLLGMGFDPVSSTSSLFNAGGNVQEALEELLRAQSQSRQ